MGDVDPDKLRFRQTAYGTINRAHNTARHLNNERFADGHAIGRGNDAEDSILG